jgi:hypothetical protein
MCARPSSGSTPLRRLVGALMVAACALLAGCSAAAQPAPGSATLVPLYVADARDGTLVRVDGTSGRVLGPPLPAGTVPVQVVPGPSGGGTALVLSADPSSATGLTFVARTGTRGHARPVPLPPGSRAMLLAGDGEDVAAVYTLRAAATDAGVAGGGAVEGAPGPGCGLALIDLRRGEVDRMYPVCAPREVPTGLALERTSEGPMAYLAVWRPASRAVDGTFLPAGARLLRLAARTGVTLAQTPLGGLPRPPAAGGSLVLAPGPDGAGRLYCLEALPGSELATWSAQELGWQFVLSSHWRLSRLAPDTLVPEEVVRLDFAPSGLSVPLDGSQAYAFDALGEGLFQIDLTTGQTAALARVPGHRPGGLVATPDRLYAANPARGQVWVFDRQRGQRIQTIRVGRSPAALSLAS